MADAAYGPRCLDAMADGDSAADALAAARDLDPMSVIRQVGVVSANGSADAFTGELTIPHAGHHVGDGWTIQANMMATDEVWPAMAAAYESSTRPFGERLLAALRAGEAAGGDARGHMSAAMLIVEGERHEQPWEGRIVDIRVDHNPDDPIAELERVYHAAMAYRHYSRGVDAIMAGDANGALRELDDGLALLPGDANMRFLQVGARMASGDVDGGIEEMRGLLRERRSWATVARGFTERGFMTLPPGVTLDEVLGDA
jgi:uncharacterized Ntn-hydrolase superfamily protein